MKVLGVPLIAQPTDGVCWYACAQMVQKFAAANGGVMKDPATVDMTKQMFDRNSTWDNSNTTLLATTLGMTTHGKSWLSLDYDCMWYILTVYGPIWTAVQKNWGGQNYGHVVVMCGTRSGASGGVFIHDPEPMKAGKAHWLTFAQMQKAIDKQTGNDFYYLSAK